MFRFLRPKLQTANATYTLGPLPDTWGAARLIYHKPFANPLESRYGPGVAIGFQYKIFQPAPLWGAPKQLISALPGVTVGSWYSVPVTR